MTDQPPARPRGRRPPISLTAWVALAVLVVGSLAGAALGFSNAQSEQVVVAQHDLPAFHAVTMKDVKLKKVPRSAVPAGALRSLSAARGHYLLTSVGAGKVLTRADIGPQSVAGTVVMPLPVRYDSLDGVDPGVRVNLLLAPTGSAGNPTVLTKVEVVEEKKTAAGDQIVFLAIPASCQQAVGQIAGRGRVILARLSG